jgi:L-iditol 2-dehydrogenase
VTVVEPAEVRRLAVRALGHTAVETVEELDGTFEAVVDCSGAAAAVQPGLALLAPRGVFLVVGYATVPQLDLAPIARRELRVFGIRSGSRSHLRDVLAAAAGKRISLPPVSVWELGEINEALAALRKGQVAGKAVISINRSQEGTWTN